MTRHWVAPGDAVELVRRLNGTDIRDVLPSIRVPTACIARHFEQGLDEAEYTTSLIPGAELVVLEGDEHWSVAGDQEGLIATIQDFVGISGSPSDNNARLRSILFTDIVGSTRLAAEMGDERWRQLLARHHSIVRAEVGQQDGIEEDTSGDGVFATFDGPARAIRCAKNIIEALESLEIEVRAGVHTGEVQTIDGKAGGLAVHIGARVSALAGPCEILVTRTVKDLVAGSLLAFEDAGEHELKGVPDPWRLYRVVES
jgi:class 3 adenylate cyclase